MKKVFLVGASSLAAVAVIFSLSPNSNPYVGKCYGAPTAPLLVKVKSFDSKSKNYNIDIFIGPQLLSNKTMPEQEFLEAVKEVTEIDCETYSN